MEARLKTGLWIGALIRRCDLAAIGVVVAARGDADSGAVLIKLRDRTAGFSVLAQVLGPDGEPAWMRVTGSAPVTETDADAYIARQRRRDPDVWVVEIECGSAATLVDGRIL